MSSFLFLATGLSSLCILYHSVSWFLCSSYLPGVLVTIQHNSRSERQQWSVVHGWILVWVYVRTGGCRVGWVWRQQFIFIYTPPVASCCLLFFVSLSSNCCAGARRRRAQDHGLHPGRTLGGTIASQHQVGSVTSCWR